MARQGDLEPAGHGTLVDTDPVVLADRPAPVGTRQEIAPAPPERRVLREIHDGEGVGLGHRTRAESIGRKTADVNGSYMICARRSRLSRNERLKPAGAAQS
jgi:hypothetical protein